MAVSLNISNILQFFSSISAILMVSFLVFISIFNGDIKGVVYLGGVLVASLANVILARTFKVKPPDPLKQPSCNIFDFPFDISEYVVPQLNSNILAFTFVYLLLPMIYISDLNFAFILFMLCLLILDGVTRIMSSCTTPVGVIAGAVFGAIIGGLWFVMFYETDNKDVLYFNAEPSNNTICKRPKQQTFKCFVYKNHQILGQANNV